MKHKIANLNKVLLVQILVILFMMLYVSQLSFAMSVDVKCVDSKNNKLTGASLTACTAYVNSYNKCASGDAKCKNDAYAAYVKKVCPSGGDCINNRDKVIANLTTNTGNGDGTPSQGAGDNPEDAAGADQASGDVEGINIDLSPLPHVAAEKSLLEKILLFVFGLSGAICFLIIVLAGFQMIIASGEPEKIAKARRAIIYSLVGLAISALSGVIVGFVIERLG